MATIQIRAERRLRRSAWNTAFCMVRLDDTRTSGEDRRPGWCRGRSRPAATARGVGPDGEEGGEEAAEEHQLGAEPDHDADGEHRRPVGDDLALWRGRFHRDGLRHGVFPSRRRASSANTLVRRRRWDRLGRRCPGQRRSTGSGSAWTTVEAPGRPGQRDVEGPQAPCRGDRRALPGRSSPPAATSDGLHHDDGVELEPVGLVGREQDEAGGQPVAAGSRGSIGSSPASASAPSQLGQQRPPGPAPPPGPGATAASSSRGQLGHGCAASATRLSRTKRGACPDRRTGRGGASRAPPRRRTRAATSTTSAGVR